jgi:hypothetical protein
MSKKSQLVAGMGLDLQILSEMTRLAQESGVSEEELHILATSKGRYHLQTMIAGLKTETTISNSSPYLRRLFEDETIVIEPTDGMRTIAQAKNVFTNGIDPDFVNWGLNNPGQATEEMVATVFEMVKDGTFENVFGSLNLPLEQSCFTQSQIIDFVVNHKDKLRQDGYGTFFLFKKDQNLPATPDNLFVASVYVRSDGLYVHVGRFSCDRVWHAGCRHRFVFPQLTL